MLLVRDPLQQIKVQSPVAVAVGEHSRRARLRIGRGRVSVRAMHGPHSRRCDRLAAGRDEPSVDLAAQCRERVAPRRLRALARGLVRIARVRSIPLAATSRERSVVTILGTALRV